MRFQRVAIVLSVFNILLLFFLLTEVRSTAQPEVSPVLRTRAIELVDENGKIRAQLDVEKTGEVVFRLRDAKGTIRAKFGAGEGGSGLSMMDDRTEATVQIRANKDGGGITLFSRDGRQKLLK
ncbi:MAG: hypothetical protein WBD27_04740 [Pyrinomonadaceae bacterium]